MIPKLLFALLMGLHLLIIMGSFGTVLAEDHRQDVSRLVIMILNAEFLGDEVDPEEGQVKFPWKIRADH